MGAGQFKQTCLQVLDEVRVTGEAVEITKRGVPVAQLVPAPKHGRTWLGSMAGSAILADDLIAPALEPEEWAVLQP
jgi:prevent-host-death family protein